MKGKMEPIENTSLLSCLEEFNEGKMDVDELKEAFNEKSTKPQFQCVLGGSNYLTRPVESAESSNKVPFPEIYEKATFSSCLESYETKALEFCLKVMKGTSSHEYWAFLNALHDYGTGKTTIADLKTKIAHDFEAFRDDFDRVLDLYTNLNRPSSSSDSIHDKDKEPNQEPEKVKSRYGLRAKLPSPSSEEHGKVKESNKHRPKRPSSSSEIGNEGKKPKREAAKIKRKLPLSSSENVTVSYYVLPGHLQGKGTDELGEQVLNGYCFSKGSGGHGKKQPATEEERKRKAKEDEENRKEDMLFETDMRKAWMRSCKKNAAKLLEAIKEGGIEEAKMEGIVKQHLKGNYLAYIERMYEDYGSRVVDLLRHSPGDVLPSIIKRLELHDTSPVCSLCDNLNLEYFDWHDSV